MRVLAAAAATLVASLLLAGCAGDPADGGDADPTPAVPPPAASPTPAGDEPPNGFCGPPQCSPCPTTNYLHAQSPAETEGRAIVRWDDIPASNRTALMADLLADAHADGTAEHEDTAANVSREMRHLYDGYAATHGGEKGEGSENLNPIAVVHEGTSVLVGWSAVVC